MKLDKEVSGCFGDKDVVFAGQPLNEGRAFGWLNSLRKREIGWQAASTQIAEYLKSRNASDARIKEQLDRASKYLRPWLRDEPNKYRKQTVAGMSRSVTPFSLLL